MQQGRKPTLEEIAEEALISRATAYRYFPGLEALLLEAALDVVVPDPGELFKDFPSTDPVARAELAGAALHDMMTGNESALRMMLINSLEQSLKDSHPEAPTRQNRRTPLIEAALAPAAATLEPTTLRTLAHALAVVVGIEAMVVFKDVLQVDDAEARRVKNWVIRTLVEAAFARHGAA
jgi:AcrR family transcriptional regulator